MVGRFQTFLTALVLGPLVAAAPQDIPGHPSELEYGPLEFEVPDAAEYRHELSNGIPVFVAEDHALPLVNLSIMVRLGAFLDPDDKPGVASFTGRMLRRGGAGSMSAEEFDEEVAFLAADISSFTGDTQGGASFDCITQVLDPTLELFFSMLKAPGFEQERTGIEKATMLEGMKQRNDSPASISRREWGWLMRGEEHFSARQLTGVDVEGFTRAELADFHAKYWRPDNMLIAVSGDVAADEILAKLEQHFSGWSPEGPEVPWPPPEPTAQPEPGVYYIEKDIPQGRVLIGHLGKQRTDWNDPEDAALMIMNDILGGSGFTSRLVKRIRSDEGLAYSAGSSFGIDTFWPGIFRMSYQSKSPTVALAAKIALEELDRIRTEPVGEEELTIAKNQFIDAFPRRFDSASSIAGTFLNDEYVGRPDDYWKGYRDRVRNVSAQSVLEAAQTRLDPSQLVYLIVGSWREIEAGDVDGRASMMEIDEGRATRIPLRDPLTLDALSE